MKTGFKQALEVLVRVAGLKVETKCTYCGRAGHSEVDGERHEMVTFISSAPEGEEDED